MKRDLDLIRKILLTIENYDGDKGLSEIQIDGYEKDEIIHNVYLLKNAGFIEGEIFSGMGTIKPRSFILYRMTWEGHDFLDACRNEGIWIKVKEKLKTVGEEVPLSVVKTLLIELISKQVLGT